MIEVKRSYKGKTFAGRCADGQNRRIELDVATDAELKMLFDIDYPGVQQAKPKKKADDSV